MVYSRGYYNENGKNPGDVVGYESKYRGTEYGQAPQAFVREDSVAKMRAQRRLAMVSPPLPSFLP